MWTGYQVKASTHGADGRAAEGCCTSLKGKRTETPHSVLGVRLPLSGLRLPPGFSFSPTHEKSPCGERVEARGGSKGTELRCAPGRVDGARARARGEARGAVGSGRFSFLGMCFLNTKDSPTSPQCDDQIQEGNADTIFTILLSFPLQT